MRWSVVVAAEPAFEPVDVAEAKDHLREDGSEQDARIAALITACRQQQEEILDRALCTQTLEYRADCFPDVIELPRAPVQSVTSVGYVDCDGATQTLDPSLYQVDLKSEPARIAPAYGECWPSTRAQMGAVTVTYVAGYAEGAAPEPVKQALLLRLADLYENREGLITGTIISKNPAVAALEAPYRVWSI